jgi:hypothetical protein
MHPSTQTLPLLMKCPFLSLSPVFSVDGRMRTMRVRECVLCAQVNQCYLAAQHPLAGLPWYVMGGSCQPAAPFLHALTPPAAARGPESPSASLLGLSEDAPAHLALWSASSPAGRVLVAADTCSTLCADVIMQRQIQGRGGDIPRHLTHPSDLPPLPDRTPSCYCASADL